MLVKLKMKKIYKSLLFFISALLLIILVIGGLYFGYKKISKASDIEVSNNLSINYLDGKKFSVKDKEELKISITNNSNNVIYYRIGFKKVKGNGSYKLLYNNIIVTEGKLKNEGTTDSISIDGLETKTYILEIENNNDKELKGNIVLNNEEEKIQTFADIIISKSAISNGSLTKVGSELSIEDEGLIKDVDDTGVTYYFRGNVTNNYVEFANLIWRIVRINGDGTVRLILNNTIDTVASYYSTSNTDYDFLNSNIKSRLNLWYEDNLNDYSELIANSKFCNDIGHDEENNYFAKDRIMINKIPSLNCLGESYNTNIGLLTIDEYMFAGGHPKDKNTKFYLYNSQISTEWYTMSGAAGNENDLYMFMINSDGSIKTTTLGNLNRGVRPVINIIKELQVSGEGTIDKPYLITKRD